MMKMKGKEGLFFSKKISEVILRTQFKFFSHY
jgi:hypothetical protein